MNPTAVSPIPLRIASLFVVVGLWLNGAGAWSAPRPAKTAQTVKLYYLRQAAALAPILVEASTADPKPEIRHLGDDTLILVGTPEAVRDTERLIATLDLPRAGVKMELWGIQVSSGNSRQMGAALAKIGLRIDRARDGVRATFGKLQEFAAAVEPDARFQTVFEDPEEGLGYTSALTINRPLSLTDIFLRMVAAGDPKRATEELARRLNEWLHAEYPEFEKAVEANGVPPFSRLFRILGLQYRAGERRWVAGPAVWLQAKQGRLAVLEFALSYQRAVLRPGDFSPYYLQQRALALDGLLQPAVTALSDDVRELFLIPTLRRIQEEVGGIRDVDYAQVGKTTVAGLSGIQSVVTASAQNAFETTPPFSLSELLTTATALEAKIAPFIPKAPKEEEPVVTGGIPVSRLLGLLGALGQERGTWRELKAGVSLTLTPSVLRNGTSAELAVELDMGDPLVSTAQQGVPPLTRITQHEVKTRVYVDTLDLFDLSTFSNQSTLNGGRGYVPIVGPLWRGIFSDIPYLGSLFSWKRAPKTKLHQSILLTASTINPTVMSVGLLYPFSGDGDYSFEKQRGKVKAYAEELEASGTREPR